MCTDGHLIRGSIPFKRYVASFIKANVEGKSRCKSLDPSFVSQGFNTKDAAMLFC